MTRSGNDTPNFTYDLFISYRRQDALPFARWLRQKLLTYRLPRAFGDRSKLKLRVYQDMAYERATEDFWSNTVLPALLASRHLGVVLTPGALERRGDGKPNWVEREIEAFTATPQGGNVFVLRGIDCASEYLPGDLHAKFPNIEQIDFRDLQSAWTRLRRRNALRDRLLTVAATLYDVRPEEMPIFRREEEKRKRRLAWSAALISTLLLAVMSVLAIAWLFQRNQARRERDLAEARQLAAQSTLLSSDDPSKTDLSLLLAVESMRRAPLFENDAAIRRELELMAKPLAIQSTTNSYSAAFAPDSRAVVVSAGDHIARLLELPGGKELFRFDHPSPVIAFALSPDGRYLATSCAQCNAKIFDTSSGRVTAEVAMPASTAMAFSPDGRDFAAAGKDNSVHILETLGWKQVLNLKQTHAVTSIKFSPDGSAILLRSDTVQLFDAANGRKLTLAEDFDLQSIDLGPARHYLTSTGHLIDATTQKEQAVMTTSVVRAAAFSPDGSSIVACGGMPGGDKTCWIFGLPGLVALRSLPQHRDVVRTITYSPDSRFIATSSAGIIRVFEAATANEVARILNQKAETSLLFSPDSRYLAADLEDENSRIYAVSGDRLLTVPNKGMAHVALSTEGRLLARAGDLQVFEIPSGNQLLPGNQSAYAVALSSHGEYLASAQSRSGFSVLNLQNNQEMLRREDRGMFPRLAFSSNGDHLATGFGQVAKVIELPGGKEIREFSGAGRVLSLAFNANASQLAIGTDRRVAIVYNLVNSEEIFRVKHGSPVHAVAFSPDGHYFASGSLDNTVLIHDLSTHNEAFRLNHEQSIFAIAFSPDSRFIATGGLNKTARIFDVSTRGEVSRFTSAGEIRELVFSPEGKYLTVASGDRNQNIIVNRYPLHARELMEEACSRLSRNLTPEESKQYLGQDIPPKTCNRL